MSSRMTRGGARPVIRMMMILIIPMMMNDDYDLIGMMMMTGKGFRPGRASYSSTSLYISHFQT